MDLKALIRTAVVRANAIAPLRRLNQIPYHLAIRRMRRFCSGFPEIRSLYLRHGLTRDDWVPGLSDIDLTLVICSELSSGEEYEFLGTFRKAYASLKNHYPMLGEVDCLTESFCNGWTRFTIRGYEAGNWRLIYGSETIERLYSQSEEALHRDSLDMALTVFEEFIMDRFYRSDEMSWIEKRSFLRIAAKVRRYAGTPEAGSARSAQEREPGDSQVLLQLLVLLEEQAAQELPGGLTASGNPGKQSELTESETELEFAVSGFNGLRHFEAFIHSLTIGYGTSYLILKDDLGSSSVNRALDGIRRVCCASGIQPLIMTRKLFEYFLVSYRPSEFLALQSHRHVMLGQDLVSGFAAPPAQVIARAVLNQSLNAMLAPGNCVLYPVDGSAAQNPGNIAWRPMFIKLYLDTGATGTHGDCLALCRELYPELCHTIDQLNGAQNQTEKTARLAHGLLRKLAREIDEKINMPDNRQSLSA